DNQLQLVQTLEVGNLRLVTGLDERFESGLDQGARAAAEHRLLAEEIRLGLLSEGRLDDARARAADAARVRQRRRPTLPRHILVNRQKARRAAAVRGDPAHAM